MDERVNCVICNQGLNGEGDVRVITFKENRGEEISRTIAVRAYGPWQQVFRTTGESNVVLAA